AALRRSAFLGSALLAARTSAAQQPSFTVDAALSAPFPSGLTAAPSGSRVAWIFDAEGARNVWVAEPSANGSFTSRQLERFARDLGVEIGARAVRVDGHALRVSH